MRDAIAGVLKSRPCEGEFCFGEKSCKDKCFLPTADQILDLPAEGWVYDHTEACSQHCEHKPECESESGCFVFNGCKRTPTLREVLDGKGVRV